MTHICVTANARYGEQVQLWSHDSAGNCKRII
jgi:hypothetical protein